MLQSKCYDAHIHFIQEIGKLPNDENFLKNVAVLRAEYKKTIAKLVADSMPVCDRCKDQIPA